MNKQITRSIRIPEEIYQKVCAKADADRRTFGVTLEMMLEEATRTDQEIVDHWLDMNSLRVVTKRWREVGGNKHA